MRKVLENIPIRLGQRDFMYFTENYIQFCWRTNLIRLSKPFEWNTWLWSLNFSCRVPCKIYFLVKLVFITKLPPFPDVVLSCAGTESVCSFSHSLPTRAPTSANWSCRHVLAHTSSPAGQRERRAKVGERDTKCPVCLFQSSIPPSPLLWKLWVEASWRLKMLYRYK